MKALEEIVDRVRAQFPGLQRTVNGRPAVFLDAPAGSQVPQSVIGAVSHYLAHLNANHGGCFATSQESDAMLEKAHEAAADLLGASDPDCVVFGPNMTTLTFALSRSLGWTWNQGDRILVTRLDHDANVRPWVLAGRDAGADVVFATVRREDGILDLDDWRSKITPRTRLVAVSAASNATGSVPPVAELCRLAREAGSLSFVDAVHFAPHRRIHAEAWGCDFLACSAYKFFGPHVGVLWGRRELLETLPAYKVRPAPDTLPGKWMTGTQNHEGIAGTLAAVEYLADLGRQVAENPELSRSQALDQAYASIERYEQKLVVQLLDGLAELPKVRVWGITDRERLSERVPTVSITVQGRRAVDVARQLGEEGIFVWHGNYYALELTETLGLEPDGMVRLGLVHYNNDEEVRRLLIALARC